jgi:hypothetical protein
MIVRESGVRIQNILAIFSSVLLIAKDKNLGIITINNLIV